MLQCTMGGVNSLALALTAAFCGANQHNHGLLVSWALQGEGMACARVLCTPRAAEKKRSGTAL
nr:hypothetical protein [Escherichia coli]